MRVWVLTEEYNDYNQNGEYFLAVFKEIPSREELLGVGVEDNSEIINNLLINGGGRLKHEYTWYFLRAYDL
jgi:hypothetical protein